MKAHQLSASKVDLAMVCQYWARGDVPHPNRPSGDAQKRGVEVHTLSDQWHKQQLSDASEWRPDAWSIWLSLSKWLDAEPSFSESEIPFLYDVDNDRTVICTMGPGGERDYLGVTKFMLPMRLDLVRRNDRELHIVDIKTGSKSNSEPAATNMQLATQAVAASRFYGIHTVHVGLVFPMKTKVHPPEWHTMDADALDLHAGRLHRVLKMIPASQPNRGDWCFRCPVGPTKGLEATCPAWERQAAAE